VFEWVLLVLLDYVILDMLRDGSLPEVYILPDLVVHY
jgi:hypothetical protein